MRWQIYCAVVLRRLPELMPGKDPIEAKVQSVFDAYEFSKSRYSEHELQHLEDLKAIENPDSEVVIKETAQDRLDKWIKTKEKFSFAEYDENLSKVHYLFMKAKFGSDIKDQWLLPQDAFDRKRGDQDLMDTARRALKDNLNIINGFTILSRIPSSYYKFRYPKKVVDSVGHDGAKVFFLKATLDRPSEQVLAALDSSKNEKLKWLTRDKARALVSREYIRGLEIGLLHEDRVEVEEVIKKAAASAVA